MDPELQQLLDAATEELQRGTPIQEINAALRSATNGQITTVDQLDTMAPQSQQPAPQAPAVPEEPRGSVAARLVQGATLGFGDEIVGTLRSIIRGTPRSEEMAFARQEVENAPGGAAAEFVGGLLGPGLGVGRTVLRGAGVAARAARGALGGGAAGGLLGAGAGTEEASLGERAVLGAGGAAAGAVGGGLLPVGAAAARGGTRAAGAISRGLLREPLERVEVGRRLAQRAGVTEPQRVLGRVDEERRRVSERVYRPLDLQHAAGIQNDAVDTVLRQRHIRDRAELFIDPEEAPTIRQLQELRESFRAQARRLSGREEAQAQRAIRDLTEAMQEAVPGLADADKQFARATQQVDAVDEGWKLATSDPQSIERTLRSVVRTAGRRGDAAAAEARQGFKEGFIGRWFERLSSSDKPITADQLRQLSSDANRRRLAAVLGDTDAVDAFLAELADAAGDIEGRRLLQRTGVGRTVVDLADIIREGAT